MSPATTTQPTRLHSLKIDNFQVLKAVDLTFGDDESLVEISGENEQGKSTILKALGVALGIETSDAPIRAGESEATVEAQIGDLTIRRRWRKKTSGANRGQITSKLEITADGAKVDSPAAVLKTLLNQIADDPIAWVQLGFDGIPGRRKQAEKLIEALRLEVPERVTELAEAHGVTDKIRGVSLFHAAKAVRDEVYTKRRDANVKAKNLGEQAVGLWPDAGKDPEPVPDVEEIANKLTEIDRHAAQGRALKDRCDSLGGQVSHIEAQLDDLRERLKVATAELAEAEGALQAHGETENPEALRDQLRRAKELQTAHDNHGRADDLRSESIAIEAQAGEYTRELEELAKIRTEVLAGIDMPVEGLTFDDDGCLLLDGLPFPQQASSEQQISVAVAVAVASNPKLQLLRIQDGNRLDSKHRAALARELDERGFQCLIEIVDETREVGIVIADGEVVADNRERVA